MKISMLAFACLAAVSGAFLAGCRGDADAQALATVNGDQITVEDLNQYLAAKPTVNVVVQGQNVALPVADTLAFQAIQDLITQRIVLQMAKDAGLMPTPDDVKKEIEFKLALEPTFVRELQARGLNMSQIRQSVTVDLAQERLLTRGIEVSMQEVDDFIQAEPQRFVEPAGYELFLILASTPARQSQIDQRLAAGAPFKEVAEQLSEQPGAAQSQGRLPLINQQHLDQDPALRAARPEIEATSVGGVTKWVPFTVQNQTFQAKFFVERKTDERKIAITPERKELIRRQMALQEGGQANDLQKQVTERLREARVNIDSSSLNELWKQFGERLKSEAGKTTDAGAPPSTTPPPPPGQ